MIKLYGFPVSNYYNKIKYILLEKGIEFEEVRVAPKLTPEIMEKSPMGKIPYIDDDGFILSESQAIAEYLEDVYPAKPLLPKDPKARAKQREIIHMVELYLDLAARPHYGAAYFGEPRRTDREIAGGLKVAANGFRALEQVCRFQPFLNGEEPGLADIVLYTHGPLAEGTFKSLMNINPAEEWVAYHDFISKMKDRPNSKTIASAQRAALKMQAMARKAESKH
jgi:glutathione S-transferase